MKRQEPDEFDYAIGNDPRKKYKRFNENQNLEDEENQDQQNLYEDYQDNDHGLDDFNHHQDQNQKVSFILNPNLADRMVLRGQAFVHSIDGKSFYFPYKKLNEPQKNYIKAMFDCLDNKQNLLIESPTGTGKTLSLLVGALSWAERHYMNSLGGKWENRIKIIYTSRAHSQLSQISKELEKTPYRPKMLLFGSRQKMCINEEIINQIHSQGDKSYNDWSQRCNIAVQVRRRQLQKPGIVKKLIDETQNTMRQYMKKSYLTEVQKNELKKMQQQLQWYMSGCKHFHQYKKAEDKKFNKEVGRSVLNNEILKDMAKKRKTTICPYFYPKRVKMMGTLYLMPYNYLLDSVILEYSTNFLMNSIIIFDEGHNVPTTACGGYSVTLNTTVLEAAKRNVQNKLLENDYDADEIELQNLIKEEKQQQQEKEKEKEQKSFQKGGLKIQENLKMEEKEQKHVQKEKEDIPYQEKEVKWRKQEMSEQKQQKEAQRSSKPMTSLDKWISKSKGQKPQRKLVEKQVQAPEGKGKQSIRAHIQFLTNSITNSIKNYEQFFKHERLDFPKPSSAYNSGPQSYNTKNTNWWVVKQQCAYSRAEIEDIIERILFSSVLDRLTKKNLKEKIQSITDSIKRVIDELIKQDKFAFKLLNLRRFYDRLYKVLYDKDYEHKFFLQITQSKKYNHKKGAHEFKGEIQIRCLSPEFSFKQLDKINPYNIIITSGTLSPMNVFADEIGLKFQPVQVGHVITQENIIVRKVAEYNGRPLKIDSSFFYGQNGMFNAENLNALFNLLIKTIECIPHGVLIIVSSFSSLKAIERFYTHEMGRDVKTRLQTIKPHVYFEPKNKLEVTMERYIQNSQKAKGAIMFCVCRAKLSEGIDFKDELCRSVIFLGIPYVSKGDPFIIHKGNYLKKIKSPHSSTWKFIEASKAINQGLGRTVRHANDYGSILLFDDRYQNTNRDSLPVVNNISAWIKKDWKVNNDTGSLQNQLKHFYSKCRKVFSTSHEMEKDQTSLKSYFENKF